MGARLLLRDALDALLPQRCLVCGQFGSPLHMSCVEALPAADGARCPRCWASGGSGFCARCREAEPAFHSLRSPFRFTGDVRRAILEAKFRGTTSLLDPLGRATAAAVPREWGVGVVMPVPLHPSRERRRGYNQSALLASVLAREIGAAHEAGVLRRIRATRPQTGLSREARLRNLVGAFRAARAVSGGVLLVDDVTTTGATFEAAARALREAGATRVYAVAVARED